MLYIDPQIIYVIKKASLSFWYYLPLFMLYYCWGMWKEEKYSIAHKIENQALKYVESLKIRYLEYTDELKEKTKMRLEQIEHHGSKTFEIKNYKKVSETRV